MMIRKKLDIDALNKIAEVDDILLCAMKLGCVMDVADGRLLLSKCPPTDDGEVLKELVKLNKDAIIETLNRVRNR